MGILPMRTAARRSYDAGQGEVGSSDRMAGVIGGHVTVPWRTKLPRHRSLRVTVGLALVVPVGTGLTSMRASASRTIELQ
jgi:hypothetical protein